MTTTNETTSETLKSTVARILSAHFERTMFVVSDVHDVDGRRTDKVSVCLTSNFVVRKKELVERAHAARAALRDAGVLFTKGSLSYTTHYGAKADDTYSFRCWR